MCLMNFIEKYLTKYYMIFYFVSVICNLKMIWYSVAKAFIILENIRRRYIYLSKNKSEIIIKTIALNNTQEIFNF